MPRLIVFGGAPSTAELAADWSTPTTSPAFEPLSSGDVEQESIEESYDRSQMHSLPDSEEPQAEAQEATTRLRPISSLRVPSLAHTPSEVLLPPPSMRSQSSVSSTGNSAQGEDSYVGATTMNNIHSGTSIDLRLPDYRFSVLSLTPLSDCHKQIQNSRGEVDVLGYVTKVEGLREIRMKDSRMAKLWKVELGDDSSNGKALGVLKVTAWDGTAEALNKDVQQGDILYLSRVSPVTLFFSFFLQLLHMLEIRHWTHLESIRRSCHRHHDASLDVPGLLAHATRRLSRSSPARIEACFRARSAVQTRTQCQSGSDLGMGCCVGLLVGVAGGHVTTSSPCQQCFQACFGDAHLY